MKEFFYLPFSIRRFKAWRRASSCLYTRSMKTILLLAGRSQRFWPLPDKYLYPLVGRTLLEHQIERLRGAGCTDLILVAGKHNIAEAGAAAPKATIVEQKQLDLGMQGALLEALPHCGKEPVLVAGCDVVDPRVYRTIRTRLTQEPSLDGLLLAYRVSRYFPGGYITLHGNRITRIVEKPAPGKEPSDLVNIVAHAHRDASVLLVALRKAKARKDDGYERALARLLKSHHYEAIAYAGPWHPVKYPWHLLELLPFLLTTQRRRIHRSADIHRTAVVEGPVVIEEGVRVLPHATIVGPAFIGKRTIIGNNALVRASSIGDDCVIGFSTEVKGSALAEHVWTHSTYIGDSLIGSNVSFGAGSVTGNLRLDEAEIETNVGATRITTGLRKFGTIIGGDSRIGIHVSINPGVKIGTGCFISSAALVSQDVPDGTFVKMEGGAMRSRPNRTRAPKPEDRKEFRKKL